MLETIGTKAVFDLVNSNHWIIKSSEKLKTPIRISEFYYSGKNVKVRSVFENTDDPDLVERYFKRSKICRLDFVTKTAEGIVAGLECKAFPLDKAMKNVRDKTYSNLSIQAWPDKRISLIIQCPQNIDLHDIAFKEFGRMKLKLQEIDDEVKGPKIGEPEMRLAKTLFIKGYFLTPRPKNVNHEKLAKELGISKPTFEKRLKKIQSEGIAKLFGFKGFTEGGKQASLKALKRIKAGK